MISVRDTFFAGTVRVTERGVSYRWRPMKFTHIEEVTATGLIEIVGDRRILSLAETFCPPAATAALVHDLQRLIIEVASSRDQVSKTSDLRYAAVNPSTFLNSPTAGDPREPTLPLPLAGRLAG